MRKEGTKRVLDCVVAGYEVLETNLVFFALILFHVMIRRCCSVDLFPEHKVDYYLVILN